MQRRELIFSATAAAFLTACGGGTTDSSDLAPGGTTTRQYSAQRISTDKEESIAFAKAAAAVFTSDSAALSFSESPTTYFLSAGISTATIGANSELIKAISLLKTKDMNVAVTIGDFDFFFSQAIGMGLISKTQRTRIEAAARKAAKATSADLIAVNFRAISPLVFGANGPKTIASALVVAAGYAAFMTYIIEDQSPAAI